jgi:drug/metabolite transporter (DMT)-like permease
MRTFGRGALAGVASAVLFGLSAPVAKLLLPNASPWLLAGVLYLGAGLGLSIIRAVTHHRGNSEAPDRLRRGDLSRLVAICVAGGAAGPVLLLLGLSRVSGVVGSLLLNLEAVFTMGLAVLVYRERLNRIESLGALLVIVGAVVLTYRPDEWRADLVGVMAVAGACVSWALDNNLTRQISHRNPLQIVQTKTLAAGIGNVVLAVIAGHRASVSILPAALFLGFISYGLSIVLDVYALRYIGAAREAAFFAIAPFAGAVAAIPLLHELFTANDYAAGAFMAVGVAFIVRGSQQKRRSPSSA